MFRFGTYYCTNLRNLSTYRVPAMQDNVTKTRLIASQLLKKRLDDNQNKKKFFLNSADLHVIGSYSQGFRPSLLVNSAGKSYLFNCCEGTQRFCYSNKIKLRNIERLFVTRSDWNNVSGALGLSLTMQDIGLPSFIIHGPEDLRNIFDATKSFMHFNTGIQCSTQSHLDGDHVDSSIRVRTVVIDKVSNIDGTDCDKRKYASKKMKMNPKLLAYVCSLPDRPGSLDPQKCREFKVPVGPLLGALKNGNDVTLPDKTVVKSVDVCSPPDLGLIFIIIECPSPNEIDLIVNNDTLNDYRIMRKSMGGNEIGIVVHFSPDEVTNDPKYRSWMDGFSEDCKHMLLMTDANSLANFIDVYRSQYLLNKLDNVLFPPLYLPEKLAKLAELQLIDTTSKDLDFGLVDADETDIRTVLKDKIKDLDRIFKVNNLDKFHIRPNPVLESVETPMALDAVYRFAKNHPDFKENMQELRDLQEKLPHPEQHEPEVIFLGTGSALPSKLRNTSGILVNFQPPYDASIILDCGEDTYGQLLRFYGPEKTKMFLRRLKMIYVSHHHADHHVGLIQLLRHRNEICREPLILLLPPGLENLLNYHNENFNDISGTYDIYMTNGLKSRPTSLSFHNPNLTTLKSEICKKLNGLLEDIILVGVDHCINAYAVTMKFRIGLDRQKSFTLAYSGDARPSEDFILAGSNCDLLIHEATFDDREKQDAIDKKHSTSIEAIQVAKRMGAKFCILTHFSQKLPKIPYFTDDFDDKVGFAFDNLAIRCPSHFVRLPIMKKILKTVFSKSISEIEARHAKQGAKMVNLKQIMDIHKERTAA